MIGSEESLQALSCHQKEEFVSKKIALELFLGFEEPHKAGS